MKKAAIAIGWLAGATVPLLVATVWIFGCCVLPFHAVMHKLMPICSMAADFFGGEDAPDATAPEPAKRIATVMPGAFRLAIASGSTRLAAPAVATAYRSFIAFGALRCDRDVGLHLLDAIFRI